MIRQATWLLTSPLRWAVMGLIGLYRVTLGRLMVGRCRFHPSCSAYALEAIRTHGALKGTVLAAWRVGRCSPLTSGGLDPVPARGSWRSRTVV